MIKEHKLEDKLNQAIAEFRKNNKQNSTNNSQESPADILYKDSITKEQKEKEEANYKSKLLKILGDKATHADILYATPKELEEKVKELGLKNKLEGIMINKVNNAEFSSNTIIKAREFIQGSEGYAGVAYQDKAGIWTIGYGHTGYVNGKPITKGMKITKEEAEELYKKDFENHIAPLKNIKTLLTKNQQIALASFIYNFGTGAFNKSELRKKVEMGDINGAASEFDKWIYVKNKNTGKMEISQGLINRRKREKDLFLEPDSK